MMLTRTPRLRSRILLIAALVSSPTVAATGSVLYDTSCVADDRDLLDKAMAAGRYAVSTSAFAECLAGELSNYAFCRNNDAPFMETATHAERVAAVLVATRNPNDVHTSCSGGAGTASASPVATYGQPHEGYAWDRASLDRYVDEVAQEPTACWRYGWVAAIIWHELMHNHEFYHPQVGVDCSYPPTNTRKTNVPHAVETCVRNVLARSATHCGCVTTARCERSGRTMIEAFDSTACVCIVPACEDFSDRDADGLGDRCEPCPDDPIPDLDGDGLCSDDNCPQVRNVSQKDRDADDVGDACDVCIAAADPEQSDRDNDGRGDACDNCPDDWNREQRDLDGDGIGNLCDADRDGDGYDNASDKCPDWPHADNADADNDGVGDPCDGCDAARGVAYDCRPRAWPLLELDPRLAGIAELFRDAGIPGPWGPWEPWTRCLWDCEGRLVAEGYADTKRWLASRPDPKRVTAEQIVELLAAGSGRDRAIARRFVDERLAHAKASKSR